MLKNLFNRNTQNTATTPIRNIFQKVISVQEIHDEVDGLESVFLKEVDDIINSDALNKPKEERKAELAAELGFVNSSVVKEVEEIKANRLTLVQKTERAKLLEEYKRYYPLDKIIPISLFEEVCEKYGLIMAPVGNYIKDIPEKNLLELKNSRRTISEHQVEDFVVLSEVTFMGKHTSEYKEYINSFIGKDLTSLGLTRVSTHDEDAIRTIARGFNGRRGDTWFCNKAILQICTKKGLYVSAPPSHLNTEGLRQLGKHHLKVIGIIEEDPIVFEYLKGDLIRIRTKWGTPDDQSYLDENIINETQN
jgi:hypothetical protein